MAVEVPMPIGVVIKKEALRLVESDTSLSFRKEFLAKRAFSVAVVQTLSDVAVQQTGDVTYPMGDPALGTGFDLSPVRLNRKLVDGRFKELVFEYQEQRSKNIDPDDRLIKESIPSRLDSNTIQILKDKEQSILEEVKAVNDEDIKTFEERVASDEKKLSKNVPDGQEIMDSLLPDASEIEAHLSEDQRKGAEMLCHVAFMNEAIRDMKSNVSRKAFRKRDKDAVTQDLTNIVTAYQSIKEGEDPENEEEVASHNRVKKLLQDLEPKKNAIYRETAKVSEEDMTSFVKQADITAQQLMMRRLKTGEQRELLADMTGHDVDKVTQQYRRTRPLTALNFAAENGLAIAAGLGVQAGLAKTNLPAWLLDPVSSGLEVGMLGAFLLGGISEAKSIRKAGYSVNVPALYLQDLASRITSSKRVQDASAATGYAGSLYALEAVIWGPLYGFLISKGFDVHQLFDVALGANTAGIGYQSWLTRHRSLQSERYNPEDYQKRPEFTNETK